jgi:intracellular multiplication protein IcmS
VVDVMSISEQCIQIAQALGVDYTLKGRKITHQEVFAVTGLLPAIAKRAEQLASLSLGYGLGLNITAQEKTMLNKIVEFDQLTPEVIRMLFITDVLYDFMKNRKKNGSVPLDELLVD